VSDPNCTEAAVVGIDHDIKGQAIYAYVTLVHGVVGDDALKKELVNRVRNAIGPFASPDVIHWACGLPKTRSGKIMRRILRKIANNDLDNMGDISTLADPSVVESLIRTR
jgi:acetyl-CoA synthetase